MENAKKNNNSNAQMGGRRRGTKRASRAARRGRRGTRRNQMGGQNNVATPTMPMANKPLNMAAQMGGASRAVGSHAEVWHGTARHTSGGLTKKDLMKNKHGRIISKKKHALGKKALKNLHKAGFKAKKGTFKLFRK